MNRLFLLLTLLVTSHVSSAEVNFYAESIVSDADQFKATVDTWVDKQSSHKKDRQLTLFSVVSNGSTPATHVFVAQVEDYAGIDQLTISGKDASKWKQLQAALKPINKTYTEGHAVVLNNFGHDGWQQGEVLAAVAMNLQDIKHFTKELAVLEGGLSKQLQPNMFRLMKTLEGGAVTHYLLISESSFAALNQFLESRAYLNFSHKVSKLRKVIATRYIYADKVWTF